MHNDAASLAALIPTIVGDYIGIHISQSMPLLRDTGTRDTGTRAYRRVLKALMTFE